MPQLDTPKLEYMASYIGALRAGFRNGSTPIKKDDEIIAIEQQPERYLDELHDQTPGTITLPNGKVIERVPHTEFWYVDGSDFVGSVLIRHYLTPHLIENGGQIGYGVHPEKQGRGYATVMLGQALKLCRSQFKFDKVRVICYADNHASIRVIEKNGGVLDDIHKRDYDGKLFHRYWIDT